MKKLKELNLSDDYLFFRVMRDDQLCKELLELIFEKKVVSVKRVSEYQVKPKYGARGICLDVYLEGDDCLYAVEMQNEKQIYLPKRSRYYQSAMDLDVLKRGDDVSKLKKNCVIFICSFPLFDGKLHRYTFRNQSQERAGIFLEDGTEKIFLSTKGIENDVSEQLLEFLEFVENSDTDKKARTEFVKNLQRKVMQIKNSQDEEEGYMMTELRMIDRYNSGLEQGLEQGRKEMQAIMKETIITRMLAKGIRWDEITSITGFDKEEWDMVNCN